MTPPRATIVITTKNRRDELVGAVESALAQSVPVEVLVMDDASDDGTPEILAERFPPGGGGANIQHHRVEKSVGYIVQRNRAARLASTPIIFSLDDDAAYPSPQTVAQTLAQFDHPRVGAVAIPYIDVRKGDVVRQRAPDDHSIYALDSFVGTAHALRRDLFLSLGGYREALLHQGEEDDFCIRLLAAGFVTRAGTADCIHHFESPRRDLSRLFRLNVRNRLLYAWHHIPAPQVALRLAGAPLRLFVHGLRNGYPRATLSGLFMGARAIATGGLERRPVSPAIYRLSRLLTRLKPLPLAQIEHLLPAPLATTPLT